MPSQRKRIGFLPSEEVHVIIEKICIANDFSQSKVTGLLVEEALISRGFLKESFSYKINDNKEFPKNHHKQERLSKDIKSQSKYEFYSVNKKLLDDDIKMINEFIEFKYFKKVMKQNKSILDL